MARDARWNTGRDARRRRGAHAAGAAPRATGKDAHGRVAVPFEHASDLLRSGVR
jgi:hypothetical protein